MKRGFVFAALFLFAGSLFSGLTPLAAQVTALDDDFEEDNPCEEGGWKCIGNGFDETEIGKWATWFSPDENPCDEFTNPDCANLYDPPRGYVRLTGPVNDARAVMWRTELIEWDNFRLTAEVELRGGSSPPADGMAIIILGDDEGQGYTNSTDEFPGAGEFAGGGGMSATGHGDYPTMIFEFDNWDNGDPDPDNNHVGFEYSPTGFPPTDQVFSDAVARVPVPLNGSGPFFFEVIVANGVVACNLTNENARPNPLPRTRMYTYEIPDFEPFEGYLGLSGSTGGSYQHHILHSIRVDTLPEGFCIFLPLQASRTIVAARTDVRQEGPFSPGVEIPVWQAGDVLDVAITLSDIRPDSNQCSKPTDVLVTETIPEGWSAMNISDGGTFDDATSTITWTLGPAQLTEGYEITYQVTAADTTSDALFSGTYKDNFEFAEPGGIAGDSAIVKDFPFDSCGGIRTWNILGPYDQPGFDVPDDVIMMDDYMTDGDLDELSFVFFPGAAIETDYGAAASNFLLPNANGHNPGDVPTVIEWSDLDGRVDLAGDVYGPADNAMAYAQCYVMNNTGTEIAAYMGISSDDSVAVIWNEDYHYTHSIARGGSGACTPQDITNTLPLDGSENDPIGIEPGENSLIVKTFNGGGGFDFSVVLLDAETLEPITDGIDIRLTPSGACTAAPFTATRNVDTGESTTVQGDPIKKFTPGATYDVTIALSNVRQEGDGCPAATSATITETVPIDWTIVPGSASGGGQVDAGKITWSLTGGPDGFPSSFGYQITAGGDAPTAPFAGIISDPDTGLHSVVGDGVVSNPSSLTDDGWIKDWLLLGPYGTPAGLSWGANPSDANKRKDFLTDGQGTVQDEGFPKAGDQVDTDYNVAASTMLLGPPEINPGGIPTWNEWRDRDARIDFNDYYAGDVNNIVMYAVTYVYVEEELFVDLSRSSDDGVQILLDDVEILTGPLVAEEIIPGSTIPELNPLEPGLHKIMVKTFEGGGAHYMGLRFLDSLTGEPVTEGFEVCLDADNCPPSVEQPGSSLRPGDVNLDGVVNISDPVAALGALFGGQSLPECYAIKEGNTVTLTEAGLAILDWNGDGGHNIADPVASLGAQFGGTAGHVLGTDCVELPGSCPDTCQ